MAVRTAIEWTDATWNPVSGCTKLSRGCDYCYAERLAERFRGVPNHPFEKGFDLTLRPHKLLEPLGWRRPRRVFVNSMSDLFHKDIPRPFLDHVFDTMEQAGAFRQYNEALQSFPKKFADWSRSFYLYVKQIVIIRDTPKD